MKKRRLTKAEKTRDELILFTLATATYELELFGKSIEYHKKQLEALVYDEPLRIFFFKHKIWKIRFESEKKFLGELIDLYDSLNLRLQDISEALGGYYEHKN